MKLPGLLALFSLLSLMISPGCKGRLASAETPEVSVTPMDSMDHHTVSSGNGKTYTMEIVSNPDIIQAGKQVIFSFTPKLVGKETEPVPLEAERGYDIHLIMVSNDLSWFDHRHPGLSDLGSYDQAYTFTKGGLYTLFAEYKPTGSTDTFQVQRFPVNGNSEKAVSYSEPRLTSTSAPFEVLLSPVEDGKFQSGKMQSIHVSLTKGGAHFDANDLGQYLSGKGHMVLISVREKQFLHVHPSVENGDLIFHTDFPLPGIYRAWLQFQTENIVHTADFVLKVEPGSEL